MDEFHPAMTEMVPIMKKNNNGETRVWETVN